MCSDTAVGQRAPVEVWRELLALPAGHDVGEGLRAIYRQSRPVLGEIIFTGSCEFECVHCIYPPEYARLNAGISPEEWERIFAGIHADLGISTFVYGGRSVTRNGVETLQRLRRALPEARIGVIDNGISMVPHRASLRALRLHWMDISFDGDERSHDAQRGRPGSFRAGLDGARWLIENRIAPKVNVLTCLTTINVGSVVRMITTLTAAGFKNFFITPVIIADGYRPSTGLVVDAAAFVGFVRDIQRHLNDWEDAHVEIEIYDARYLQHLLAAPDDLGCPRLEGDHLTWQVADGAVPFAINYYPLSLAGTRELIVNSNGDVILPKAMAKGSVTVPDVLGNLREQTAVDVVNAIPNAPGFALYAMELQQERKLLGPSVDRFMEDHSINRIT